MTASNYRPVLIWPDPMLSRQAAEVPEFLIQRLREGNAPELHTLLDDMAGTLLCLNGGGLAAPQISEPWRIIVLRIHQTQQDVSPAPAQFISVINPVVAERSQALQNTVEGCLSFPGVRQPMRRPTFMRVTGVDADGLPIDVGGDGLLAVALAHEMDHLDGITLADQLSPLKRELAKSKMGKAKARGLRYRTLAEIKAARGAIQ